MAASKDTAANDLELLREAVVDYHCAGCRKTSGLVRMAVQVIAEKRFRGNVASLFDTDVELGIEIDSETTVLDWDGEQDYDHIIWVMNQEPAELV